MKVNTKILKTSVIVIVFCLLLFILWKKNINEGFSNNKLNGSCGYYPEATDGVIAPDIYPRIHRNTISNNNASDIWWHYPVFPFGKKSYDQITNNIRYPNNPDEGTCTPASMCGALYHETNNISNYITTLPPLKSLNNHPRVGYFYSKNNFLI